MELALKQALEHVLKQVPDQVLEHILQQVPEQALVSCAASSIETGRLVPALRFLTTTVKTENKQRLKTLLSQNL